MEDSIETHIEDTSILSNLSSSNEEEDEQDNYVITNNGYTCDKCNLVPEITNIDFIKNTIEINCSKHKSEITWNDFINNTIKCNYYFSVCDICHKNIQKNNNNIYKYCYNCNKIICGNCYLNHNNDHKVINNNEYNNKCQKHFNQTYTSYCFYCKENICNECKRTKIHKDHKKYDFIEIDPTEDELGQIKGFCSKYENNLNKIKTSGKKEINELENYKNKLLINIEQSLQIQEANLKEEYDQRLNNNTENFEKKKNILNQKYNEDLKKLIDEFNLLKLKYENDFKNSILLCKNNYINTKNKIESDYDSLIIKCKKINKKLIKSYKNIIKLNDIIINSYKSNKNQFFYIINVTNNIQFIKKYIQESPQIYLKEINDKYNININNEYIEIIKKIITNEGIKNIISEIDKETLLNILINTSYINNNLHFFGNFLFNQLKSISVINCNINDISNLKNVKCPQLTKIDLSKNKIKDINIFQYCNFRNLEYLNLSDNIIEDINVFEEPVFSNLKELNLSYNKIEDIKVFNKVQFTQIETLILSYNIITNIHIFNWKRLMKLTNLFLDNQYNSNSISNFSLQKKIY